MTSVINPPKLSEILPGDRPRPTNTMLVDTDLHPIFIVDRDIAPRLEQQWREHLKNLPPRGTSGVPRLTGGGRGDPRPNGIVAGTDLSVIQDQVLDLYDVDFAACVPFFQTIPGPPDFDVAFHHAINLWQKEDLCRNDPRMRGSIRIAMDVPDQAVAEIERWSGDPDFIQVQISENSTYEWGDKRYWPIYAAAEAAGLPIMAHVGSPRGYNSYNGAGSPSYYVEQHIYVQFVIERIATSLICAGVFEQYPKLNLVLLESCIAWAGPLQWAMDTLYEKTRGSLPTLQAKPSEYFQRHVWFSTQPIEEPIVPSELVDMYELSKMTDHIMFATDYPHWDFDAPDRTLPAGMPKGMREKILGLNAANLYNLPIPPHKAPKG